MSISNSMTQLVARRKAAAAATARQTVAESVKKQALGQAFTDAELDNLRDSLDALQMPPEAVDELAAQFAEYAAAKKAVADLPTPEQMAETKKKLIDELIVFEGKMVVAQRFGIGAGDMSAATNDQLAALRVRLGMFGQAEHQVRDRFQALAAKLAWIFALVGEPSEPKPAEEPKPTTEDNPAPKGRKATAGK